MPMIDVYAVRGTFSDPHRLAMDAAALVKAVEGVPDIPMFRNNTAAFVHELPAGAIANVDGDGNYVRVQVLTNAGALDADKRQAVVAKLKERNIAGHQSQPGWRLVDLDLRDRSAMADRLTGKYDAIVHLAAKAGVRPSIDDPLTYQEVNVGGNDGVLLRPRAPRNAAQFDLVWVDNGMVYDLMGTGDDTTALNLASQVE